MTWLVVGLGNPGPKYAETRHNIGFKVVEELARRWNVALRDKFKGQAGKGLVGREDAVLLMPMTFMNVSGTSVGAAATFYKVPQERVVVVHDELDLGWRSVRVKVGGGHAGHNGLRSIFQHCGKDFIRLRCGIGRPARGDVSGYVLGRFDEMERAELPDVVDAAADAVELVLREGPRAAMNTVHAR